MLFTFDFADVSLDLVNEMIDIINNDFKTGQYLDNYDKPLL